ncbi:MAG: hypothetical protein M1839_004177 [Geoglossum umbratile]|nr:MAG: hypothetical protein M1839_004177 [Geoglossum umbratile]
MGILNTLNFSVQKMTSITQARVKELELLLARKREKVEELEKAEAWMEDLQSQSNEETQSSILSSSSAARQNRKKHKDRATLGMEETIRVHMAKIEDLAKEIKGIEKDIKLLSLSKII